MNKHKPYTPTICNRKLHRLTLVTEKNIGKVMGDLNRFLSKPTMVLRGFTKKAIDTEYIDFHGDLFPVTQYAEEETPNYVPFVGYCDYHYLWKKYLAGEECYTYGRKINEIPRLAISSSFEMNCCPISIGSRYKIYGRKLVILEPFNKFIHRNPYSKPSWLRYSEYIQVDSLTEKQIFDIKACGLSAAIGEGLNYASEELQFRISGQYNRNEVYDAMRDAVEMIDRAIPYILKDDVYDTHTETIEIHGKELVLVVNVKEWLSGKHGDDVWYFKDGDDKTQSIVQAMCTLYRSEIAEWNSKPDDSDNDESDDFYGDLWDY